MMQIDPKHSPEETKVIQANPLLATLRTTSFILFLTVILFLAMCIFLFVNLVFEKEPFVLRHSGIIYIYVYALMQSSFILVINVRQIRYWKKIDQKRFAAVQENRALLTAERPTLLAEPMWLPGTLELRYTKNFWLRTVGMVLLMALLLAGIISSEASLLFTFFTVTPHFFLVCFCISSIVLLALIFALLPYSVNRQNIEPTEHGLTTRYAGKTATVRWSEARLFAFYDTLGVQKSGASITYELSSARNIVRWTWVQRKTRFMGQEPIATQDEYNHQMQGLLALVQARTGLPLYDLRQQRVSLPEDSLGHPLANP